MQIEYRDQSKPTVLLLEAVLLGFVALDEQAETVSYRRRAAVNSRLELKRTSWHVLKTLKETPNLGYANC